MIDWLVCNDERKARAEWRSRECIGRVRNTRIVELGIPKQIARVLGRFQRNHNPPRPNPCAILPTPIGTCRRIHSSDQSKSQTLGKQGTDAESRDGDGDDDGGNCSGVIRVIE